MKYKILSGCVVLGLAMTTSSAQTKSEFSGKCGKPDVQQSIPAADKDGHVFLLMQGKCTAKGEVSGVAAKEATYSQHGKVTGASEPRLGESMSRRLIMGTRFSTTIKRL
jgi:hypothetical protein